MANATTKINHAGYPGKANMTPYVLWIVTDDGEYPLFSFVAEIGLSDADVKTAALAELAAITAKINSPGDDTIDVRTTVLFPTAHQARQFRHQETTP